MKNVFGISYEEEFVDCLIYLNEIYGDEFECDGDSLHAKIELETFVEVV
ncbi:hypothetical protein ACG-M12_0011 [Escherichia phage vB_EcoS_ACG-M12]|uniref:Uncharacterized protein n=2 Tax=Guelphvirus TaxID=2732062 RepID=K4FBR9_9CAUD|nr:hypothetical protein D861_gp68 [Escherichia phage vB_EcoS_ACG-M12]AFH19892.1 hypothetical protein ACG-M12_0011 [Escherichia phage vB_EcoS_ACG-M12]UOX39687.1 hypothetical protein [Escherichia phage vB_EcoS_SCS31]